ncbi:hypothetical protein ACNQFN_21105 [Thauera butanivorans]|uniref:hypothetical protein n=1 Tax=Thauera butanivorans TaxID=86174 RepID=UPI003AB55EE4
MKFPNTRHATRAAAAAVPLIAVLALGGCAALDSRTPEQIVAERAAARWEAIIANDWQAAYEYATPGYRAANKLEAYQGRLQSAVIRRQGIEVSGVECPQADSCTATLLLAYQPLQPGFPSMKTRMTERWILEEGRWYIHLPL